MKRLFAVSTLLLLFSCAQLGLQPADNFEKQLAYSYASVASIRTATANALTTGVIKVEDAQQVQALADQSRVALDAAKVAMTAGDTTTAMGRLQLANSILNQLAIYLQKSKEAK